jgi:uncharacterized protein YcgI (DUF1989 family)
MVVSVSSPLQKIRVPAGKGRAFKVYQGNMVAIIDVIGGQCTDFWAVDAHNFDQYLSPPYTIVHIQSLQPKVGDQFVTNYRQPILTVMADDVGRHDLLYPACDRQRYKVYFGLSDHRNCHDNFLEAVAEYHWGSRPVPFPPFNVFMNTNVEADGRVVTQEPLSKPGDKLILRAEMDIICVASSCPMDLTPTGSKGITDVDILVAEGLQEIYQLLQG